MADSICVIIIGAIVRFATVFMITFKKQFNNKERVLMAISWGSKGSITATLGGLIAAEAKSKGD